MNIAIAFLSEFQMHVLPVESPATTRPADDATVSQERIQVTSLYAEGFADLRWCITVSAVAIQLCELIAQNVVCLVEHFFVTCQEANFLLFHNCLFLN